jgi:thioredoxin-related protein
MKRIIIVLALMMGTLHIAEAQTEFRALSYSQAKRVAKKEHKLLFIDFYSTKCGACKMMDKKVFPQKEVGDFMNEHFVCVKLDTHLGSEGAPYVNRYKIKAVPTFVIIDPSGWKILYNKATPNPDGKAFIEMLRQAIGK